MTRTTAPIVSHSDVVYMIVRRLERAADLMVKHEYGAELEENMAKVAELFEWLNASVSGSEEA